MNEGLGFEPATAVEHLRASDETLARVIDSVGPFRLQLIGASSIFGALAQAIVYQQLNGKAAAAIFARFCALFPGTDPTAELVLARSEEELRGAGLSRSKLLSLRDLAGKTVSGEIPTLAEIRLMEDGAIIERLTSVRGIGRWTVEMLLIFRLGRPDVLPADDYGIRKGFARLFAELGVSIDADDPIALTIFPEMDGTVEVPEITEACWGILGKSPEAVMCATSRMIVKRKGAIHPTVVACTLLPYDARFELGRTLGEAGGAVPLNHPHCAKFCVLGGGACSR